jgi:hypothetical protein
MDLLRTSLSTDTRCDLPVPGAVTLKSGAWVSSFMSYRPLLIFPPDSVSLLNRISPEPSGFHPYICKGVHFADKGESLLVTYTESHTMSVPLFCHSPRLFTSVSWLV